MLIKNFINTNDVSYYFFNYGIDEYVEIITKHHINEIMDVLETNEDLKTEFINFFENDSLGSSKSISPETTINNFEKLILMQKINIKYFENDSTTLEDIFLFKKEVTAPKPKTLIKRMKS